MTTVTLIPGDGIGPEVTEATRKVVDSLNPGIEWEIHQAGLPAIESHGTPLPPHVLDSIRQNRIALKGPVTTPVGTGFRSINVALRQELDLFSSVRPCRLFPGVPSHFEEVDIIVVRENTEDLYEGIEFQVPSAKLQQLRIYLNYKNNHAITSVTNATIKLIAITTTSDLLRYVFSNARDLERTAGEVRHKRPIVDDPS